MVGGIVVVIGDVAEVLVEGSMVPPGQVVNWMRSIYAVTSALPLHVTPIFAASVFPSETPVKVYCCQPFAVGVKSL
jgi:hypothetical protein